MDHSNICPACSQAYTGLKIPKLLSKCLHTICSTCVANLWHFAQNTPVACPICNCPIMEKSPGDIPNNYKLLVGATEPIESRSLHFIGDSWVVRFKEASSIAKTKGIALSTEQIEHIDILFEAHRLAKSGHYKFLPNIVLFAGLGTAWHLIEHPRFAGVRFLEPNPRFSSQNFLIGLHQLNDALLHQNKDTRLLVFLPPAVDVNTYNKRVAEASRINWGDVIFNRPSIQKENIVAHTRYSMSEFMPENFQSLPSNVTMLPGLDIFNSLPPYALDILRQFMLKKLDHLYLADYLSDGYNPNEALISKFFSHFQTQLQVKKPNSVLAKARLPTTVKKSNSYHLLEAARFEFATVIDHLITVRDVCYPNVSNSDLEGIGIEVLKEQFRSLKL